VNDEILDGPYGEVYELWLLYDRAAAEEAVKQ